MNFHAKEKFKISNYQKYYETKSQNSQPECHLAGYWQSAVVCLAAVVTCWPVLVTTVGQTPSEQSPYLDVCHQSVSTDQELTALVGGSSVAPLCCSNADVQGQLQSWESTMTSPITGWEQNRLKTSWYRAMTAAANNVINGTCIIKGLYHDGHKPRRPQAMTMTATAMKT